MSNLRTVKQVCELTGLNRKLLFDYKDVVKPSSFSTVCHDDKDGYKLYDDDAVIKLQQIAIFRELKWERKDIKKIISAPDYDCNEVIEQLLVLLEEEKKKIDEYILAVQQIKFLGMKNNVLDYFGGMSMSTLAKRIKVWQESYSYQYMYDVLKKESRECDQDNYLIIKRLCTLGEVDFRLGRERELVKKLFEVNIKYYGISGVLFLLTIAICFQGEGELSVDFGVKMDTDNMKKISRSILDFFEEKFDFFLDRVATILLKYEDVMGKDFSDSRVKEMIEMVKEECNKEYGLKKKEDYDVIFWFAKVKPYKRGDSTVKYVLNALKYYCT